MGLVNCVHKSCPTALYSVVQSHCSILSHDTLHHHLSSNSCLENDNRELGHLFRYCRNCKNTSTILREERGYSATGNSRVHYLKSGYVIKLIAFWWDMACIHSSPDPSLFSRSGPCLRDQVWGSMKMTTQGTLNEPHLPVDLAYEHSNSPTPF